MKSLKELLGEDFCREFLTKYNISPDKFEEVLNMLMLTERWYPVTEKLPEFGKKVFCIFPPTKDNFYAHFREGDKELGTWTCFPETGGWLGDEEELVWCELDNGEYKFP